MDAECVFPTQVRTDIKRLSRTGAQNMNTKRGDGKGEGGGGWQVNHQKTAPVFFVKCSQRTSVKCKGSGFAWRGREGSHESHRRELE